MVFALIGYLTVWPSMDDIQSGGRNGYSIVISSVIMALKKCPWLGGSTAFMMAHLKRHSASMPAKSSSSGVNNGKESQMKHIYTFGSQPAQRTLTVGCLLKNKAVGKRMTQVIAFDAGEAATAADQGIDTLTIDMDTIALIRVTAPYIFITAGQAMRQ